MKIPASLYGGLTGASIQKLELHENLGERHQQELIACESTCAFHSLHVTRDPPSLSRLHMLWFYTSSYSHTQPFGPTTTQHVNLLLSETVIYTTQLLHSRRWSGRFATPCRPRLQGNSSLKPSTSWRASCLLRRSSEKALLSPV
jgi:hypothetical protein